MSEGIIEITASWKGEMSFLARNAAGGTVQMGTLDGKPGVSPMQLLLVAIAGCTGDDIVSILKKKQAGLDDFQVRVSGKRALNYPKIWTDIHITYIIWGNAIKPKDVEHAITLSENKYCSVGLMLGKSARITSEYQILKKGKIVE
jgi:putative redox protein